jgi:2-keto-4-pentenoate hydratase/2-oxohepta-3-ene-1,7-dioic acid hydratase in catechol pathway
MKLLSYRDSSGSARVGRVENDTVTPLRAVAAPGTSPLRALLLEHGSDLGRVVDDGEPVHLQDVDIQPVVPDPTKIVAAPVNYFDHKAEMNEDAHIDALGVFLKAPSSVLAHEGLIRLPYTDRRFDQEGELAFVIGERASHVSRDDAQRYIAGYTVLMDMTLRGGEDRSVRKSFDTFTPVGPYLVTRDEAGAWQDMRLQTWVNEEQRQDADLADLIWGVDALLEYVSSVMVLEPGDIVATGTPAGVGQVHAGDVIRVAISGVGELSAGVTSDGAVVCPTRGANRGPKPPETVTPLRTR